MSSDPPKELLIDHKYDYVIDTTLKRMVYCTGAFGLASLVFLSE
jgi:hypothetical protein